MERNKQHICKTISKMVTINYICDELALKIEPPKLHPKLNDSSVSKLNTKKFDQLILLKVGYPYIASTTLHRLKIAQMRQIIKHAQEEGSLNNYSYSIVQTAYFFIFFND